MADFIIVVILLVIVGAAVIYLIKAKKSGAKCVGCPAGGTCAHRNSGGCSCGGGGVNSNCQE